MVNFREKLQTAQSANDSFLCVGLDPDRSKLPKHIAGRQNDLLQFCMEIVDATADLAIAFKPQAAFFQAEGDEIQLKALIDYIHETTNVPVILDAKRGDIGNTARMYARESFEYYNVDAVTVNPYMGPESFQPFLDYKDRGTILLCRTSNPGADWLQNQEIGSGKKLYEFVAEQAVDRNDYDNIGLVAGATNPAELARIREIVGDMPLLLPGLGSQGGDAQAAINAAAGGMFMASASRAINYAGSGADFAEQARNVADKTRQDINRYLAETH